MLATILLLGMMAWADGGNNGSKKKTGVNVQPFLNTRAGASTWSSGDDGVMLAPYVGAQAGLAFNQRKRQRPRIAGVTRASYTRAFSFDADSTDIRVGLFAGPAWKYLRLRTGPDYFYNVARWGGTEVPEISGLAWLAEARLGKPKFQLTGGVQPAFYRGNARQGVDWGETDAAVGIGDEMTVYAGFSAGRVARLNLQVSQTTTAYGTQRGFGISFALGRG